MLVPQRNYQSPAYRYGFNGMEKDDEIKSYNNSYDFGARMYDPRVGRWFKPDPLERKYSSLSPYVYSGNNPILFTDFDGMDFGIKINHKNKTITIVANIYTISEKTYLQAMKASNQWNKISEVVDGYTINFEVKVIKPKTVTESEIKEILRPAVGANAVTYSNYNDFIGTNRRKKRKISKKVEALEMSFRADDNSKKDEIGNLYKGTGVFKARFKSNIGGVTDGHATLMYHHPSLGDLGKYSDLVAHEIGHLFGLDDEGDEFFSPNGIMKYSSSGTSLKKIHIDDIKNILNYVKKVINGTIIPTKGTTNSAKVKVIENIGESNGDNPIGIKSTK